MTIDRREFIAILGSVATWPLAAQAQQPALPLIGFLNSQSSISFAEYAGAFRRGLQETGFIEGQNVVIEYRWADGHLERLPTLVADLVQRRVSVIAATGATGPYAVRGTPKTISIVFTTAGDPVAIGLVDSLNRPGGNVTGVTWINWEIEAKQLELLREAIPGATKIAVLSNPNTPGNAGAAIETLRAAANDLGLEMIVFNGSSNVEIEAAFASAAQARVDSVLMRPSAYWISQLEQIVALELRYRMPTSITGFRDAVAAGVLMSYGASISDSYRQAGAYVGRILKGEKASDLPVQQPTKFELTINMKTAKALGLTVPPSLLAIADEVIE